MDTQLKTLMDAIARNDIEEVKKLLAQNLNLDQNDEDDDTPLILAVRQNNAKVVEMLLEAGADVNKAAEQSSYHIYDPLSNAIERNNAKIVQILINYGADVYRFDYLEEACSQKSVKIVKILLEKGVKLTKRVFESICESATTEILNLILEYKEFSKEGGKFITTAAEYENWNIVRTLLEKGVNVNSRNEFGETALHIAVKNEIITPVKMLLEAGADVHIVDSYRLTPLKMAYDTPKIRELIMEFSKKDVSTEINELLDQSQQSDKEAEKIHALQMYRGMVEKRKESSQQVETIPGAPKGMLDTYRQMFGMPVDSSQHSASTTDKSPKQTGIPSLETLNNTDKFDEWTKAISKNAADSYKQTVDSLQDGEMKEKLRGSAQNFEQTLNKMIGSVINEDEDESAASDMFNVMSDMLSAAFTSYGDKIVESGKHLDALTTAIIHNDVRNLELLLDKTDVNATNSDGATPLMISCYFGYENAARILLDFGADSNMVGQNSFAGETALTMAVEQPIHNKTIAILLEHGADINHQNAEGNTSLMKTILHCDFDSQILITVCELLQMGADIALCNKDGKNAQQIAEEALQTIESYNQDSYYKDKILILGEIRDILRDTQNLKNIKLLDAARKGNVEQMTNLIADGAQINSVSCLGTTLSNAIISKNNDAVAFLVKQGANVNIEDHDGGTPLLDAITAGNLTVSKWLIEAGAKVNCKDKHGATPLLEAAAGGYPEIVQLLIDCGANLQDKIFNDRYLLTKNALDLARENARHTNEQRYQQTIQILQDAGLSALHYLH